MKVGINQKTRPSPRGGIIFFILFVILAAVSCFGVAAAGATEPSPEASLRKDFPQLPFESLQPSVIKGLYEVETDRGILYYAPDAACLIIGNVYNREGKNLTQELQDRKLLARAKTLPLAKALKIGDGRHTVIEFTDPDCPYCRKAARALADKKDLTRYIFFYPLSQTSAEKVRHILCAPDPIAAYKESYRGALDKKPLQRCDTAAVRELMQTHQEQGRRLGIEGTPFFIIDGRIVPGADMSLIEKLLTGPEAGPQK